MKPASGEHPLPAPFFLRMVAFAMDCIFVILASLAVAQAFFPNDIQAGFNTWNSYLRQFQDLEEGIQKKSTGNESSKSSGETNLDQNNTLGESNDSLESSASVVPKVKSKEDAILELQESLRSDSRLVECVRIIVFSLFWVGFVYWFAGERFYAGSSLGKRMFSLATIDLRDGMAPLCGISLLRAFFKIAPVLMPLLTFSYFIVFFNRRFMAGHDFACRTMVIRGQSPLREREESTNAMD